MSLPIGFVEKLPRRSTVFWFLAATLLGIWPALTNRQPFFNRDTTAYVRGADLAISKVLGSRFATDWAEDQRRIIRPQTTVASATMSSIQPKSDRRVVLAGRSIIYGTLLYSGEILGGMWLSIILQSLVAVYLVFIFVVRTLGLDFRYFLITCAVLFTASSLPFFVSYLMPDVFAGFLILTFAILAASWERLGTLDRSICYAVMLFAVLSHTTHLCLVVGLTILTAAYTLLVHRSNWYRIRRLVAIVATVIVITALWELAFSLGIRRFFGIGPVHPPFVTAALVSMLGEPAVAKVCRSNNYAVCRFQDRFPVDCETFLWSDDERIGVFTIADVPTKQLLDAEQVRFALAIVPPNLGRFVGGISRNTLRELTSIGLSEYSYNPVVINFLRDRLPRHHFERLTSTLAARSDAYAIFGRKVLYGTTTVGVIIIALLLCFGAGPQTSRNTSEKWGVRRWSETTGILFSGIVLNAAICGGFSQILDRYEARVIWLTQLAAITGILTFISQRDISLDRNLNLAQAEQLHVKAFEFSDPNAEACPIALENNSILP